MEKSEVNRYNELKNLGYMNSWHTSPPEEVVKCRRLKHIRNWHQLDNCVEEIVCYECGYKYKIDSGD